MAEAPLSIARELTPRLPRTFAPAVNAQLKQWETLFPAERRSIDAQLRYLAGLPAAGFSELFGPLVEVESRMELPPLEASSVRDTGILARSPLYPQWRGEVEKVFAKVDAEVEKSTRHHRRLVICVLPPGLPLEGQPLWPDLGGKGFWIQLARPFGESYTRLGTELARRAAAADLEPIERTWAVECDTRLSTLAESSSATVLSWAALGSVRREFLDRLNHVRRDLTSVDQTNDDLKKLNVGKLLPPALGKDVRVREFIRGLLLSGNGSLVFNNSFVQWGASEAMRRVQPQVMIASFGMRPKIKPFSGSVLFEDQTRSNPVPDEDDPAGSLVDALQLSNYVYYSSERVTAYQGRTLTLFAACGLDRVLAVGAVNPPSTSMKLSSEQLARFALEWVRG